MDAEGNEFPDWEVLHHSDESVLVDPSNLVEKVRELEDIIEGASEGMVQTDYFSLDSRSKYSKDSSGVDLSEGASVEYDNPAWIDPVSETQYPRKESSVFWSDSSSDRSDDRKLSELDKKIEFVYDSNPKIQFGFEGLGETGVGEENPGKFWSDSGVMESVPAEFQHSENNSEVGFLDNENTLNGSDLPREEHIVDSSTERSEQPDTNDHVAIQAVKSSAEEGKKYVVWWKLPMDFFKHCVFRISPVWTFSLAAAVLGFAILARRFYKMKRRSYPLKVTVDDKKVSQFMSRAARLNEAFSVVKRVPVIRPSLPAAGMTQWPVMSMR